MLEPANALITDVGAGWTEVDRWYTEGAMTHWGTGCSGFDRLGDIFNHGTPQTVVWARGDERLFQRTDDFGWDAREFADAVEQVPSTCPTVEIGATTVSVTAVDSDAVRSAADRITRDDPEGRVVAIAFDAYPHPSLETDTATPEFEPGRPTWMVVATRHNVVSQLVYSPADGTGVGDLPELVAAQVEALLATPIEASGPVEQPAPPPSVAPGTAIDVGLFVDAFTCRNDGFVELDGIRWALAEPVPHEWRERNPIRGDLAMDGTTALFTAYPGPPPVPGEASADDGTGREPPPLDGFTVALTTGAVPADCSPWEVSEPAAPTSKIGRLDCDDRPVTEVVVPDVGQTPDDLAVEANPQTVRVQSDGPLQWSGLDGGGRVIVAVFLGDAENADWQIFTCASP
ncbi:MAG: hypothetical protein AAFN30_14240 [Actinomycetota bacterium]